MNIAVLKESSVGELRVAMSPQTVERFNKLGFDVYVEGSAGLLAQISDKQFEDAGATIVTDRTKLLENADAILKVAPPTLEEVDQFKEGQYLFSYLYPGENAEILEKLKEKGVLSFAMDAIPRISRAQKMDVLSSMSNISGYRAVIDGCFHFGRYFAGQITAAGKIEPAKVLIIGTGVAGLQAIGTAKNLGAIVRAFDTRLAAKEQVESLGAKFLTVEIEEDGSTQSGYSKEMSQAFIDAEMALFEEQAREVDVIITTALIPGRKAPILITKQIHDAMKPGSVIVDLAYPRGGNCELTKSGEVYTTDNGVTIVGTLNQMPSQAARLYSNNIAHLLSDISKDGVISINLEDDVVKGALITYQGEVRWPPAPLAVQKAPVVKEETKVAVEKRPSFVSKNSGVLGLLFLAVIFYFIGKYALPSFLGHFTVFVLACFTGWKVIWNVSHSLHTPLMSATNAISGIVVIGAIIGVTDQMNLTNGLTLFALLLAAINIIGGFAVTQRMLNMFKR